MGKITAEEFIDKVDELCFKYKYEIVAEMSHLNVPIMSILGDDDEACASYIDGDGRGK